MTKEQPAEISEAAMTSEIARVFSNFTSLLHIKTAQEGDYYRVTITDLQFGEYFLPSADIVLNSNKEIISQGLRPFHQTRN